MTRALSVAGAIGFLLWGALHIAAARQVYDLGLTLEANAAQGRIFQDAFYLLAFACASMLLGVGWVWRGDARMTWIAIGLAAIADVPFVIFLAVPGLVGPPVSFLGPGLWAIASVCSLAALISAPKSS